MSIELFSTLQANQNREQSLALIANKKSTKIPDPPTLIDSQSPTFESWLSKIKNKLRVNADYFVDEDARIAYVQLCLHGEAREHVQPRLDEGTKDPFTTIDEILQYLQSIYKDLNQVFNAKNDF